MTPPKKVELGMEVKDRITGFTGIATSRTIYLNACDRISVAPKVPKEGTLPETEAFDEPDLEIVGDGIYVPPKPIEPPGGPHPIASRSKMASRTR